MDNRSVLRLAGVAAIAGAAVDILGPLVLYPRLTEVHANLVYVAIDLLLLLAMLGVRSASGRATGALGLIGFVAALAGVLLVRTSAARIFGEASYMIASSVWSIGLVIWGLDLLRAKTFRIPAGLWIAAFLIGLVGLFVKDHGAVSHLAKFAFIGGFICAGVHLIGVRK